MSIASELIDKDHPPPAAMLLPTDEEQSMFFKVKPSRAFVPFRLNLPLNVGPGPFHSVRARIRYVIHGTILISINGHKTLVRCCRDIRIISALDPETALTPLQNPLLATEEHFLRWGGHDKLKVTAGLHRAVWVSGAVAYIDVNIVNNTHRHVRKIRVKLRRHILAYKNSIALTEEKSAGHLRVPTWIERKTLAHSELNIGSRWQGVKGSQLDVVTCEIDIPRNQLSVKMGRYFEVKYFVDVAVCTRAARTVRVQLPITIVHMVGNYLFRTYLLPAEEPRGTNHLFTSCNMISDESNSLDIMPNSLLQVARKIQKSYGNISRGAPDSMVGRAFTAPRQQALVPDRKGSRRQPRKTSGAKSKKDTVARDHTAANKKHKTKRRGTSLLEPSPPEKTPQNAERIDISVPSLGLADPFEVRPDGMKKEVEREQQREHREVRRGSVASARETAKINRRLSKEVMVNGGNDKFHLLD
ncbi:hypothetical protein RUND412_009565 [Rhizina undulata]